MVIRRLFDEIVPEQTYSIGRAARYLGVHRCTIYDYIRNPDNPLPFIKVAETGKLRFYGSDLIAYKIAGATKERAKTEKRDTLVPLLRIGYPYRYATYRFR